MFPRTFSFCLWLCLCIQLFPSSWSPPHWRLIWMAAEAPGGQQEGGMLSGGTLISFKNVSEESSQKILFSFEWNRVVWHNSYQTTTLALADETRFKREGKTKWKQTFKKHMKSLKLFGIEMKSNLDMSQLLLLGKFEYGGGLIFKVVLEC